MSERMTVAGRHGRLEVFVGGAAEGPALIRQAGTPNAGLQFERSAQTSAALGMRLISYARPGYAGSARHQGRCIADCAIDVVAIANALGIERFHTVGLSGGGPHALATAALLPERVISAAVIGSLAPWTAEDLDYTAGMEQSNIEEVEASVAGEGALRALTEAIAPEMATVTGAEVAAALGELVSDVDRATLTPDFLEYLASEAREALSNGVDGWVDDDLAFVRDWGFELDQITVPVTVWQGRQDSFVPFSHGQWLADNVPGARPQLRSGEGHLSIEANLWAEVLTDLLAAYE